jgi:inner membrane protein
MNNLPDNNSILIILGFLAILAEVALGVATGFELLIIGVIFIIAGGIGMLVGSFVVALLTITVLSLFYIMIGRKFIKQKLSISTTKTNTDKLIGQTAVVLKAITDGKPGQVKIDGEIWRASSSENIENGTEVVVKSVSGVTLEVTKKA